MAYTYTFATLQTAVQAWVEDTSTELSANFADIADAAELQLIRELDFTIFDTTATGTATSAAVTKPAGCISILSFWITVSGAQILLHPRTIEYVREYGGTGTPLYYAEDSETALAIAPAPTSQAYTLRHVKRPTPISESAGAGTWCSLNAPDALLWAAIDNALVFLKNETRRPVARENYKAALENTKLENRQLMRRSYP